MWETNIGKYWFEYIPGKHSVAVTNVDVDRVVNFTIPGDFSDEMMFSGWAHGFVCGKDDSGWGALV